MPAPGGTTGGLPSSFATMSDRALSIHPGVMTSGCFGVGAYGYEIRNRIGMFVAVTRPPGGRASNPLVSPPLFSLTVATSNTCEGGCCATSGIVAKRETTKTRRTRSLTKLILYEKGFVIFVILCVFVVSP